ncbi:SDR family NAD(P)-dependent oxidoreductase [Oceanicola sp. 502str15]|uniref:SDR family NAD(P)-dependent oxidoreductase n=1 Tax=Oceanicola sp. 502str15 TaxID=2696061 RepID=UPI0020965DBE|nr:3-oxoacyl-ACP reductase FabG [Oceanicola sp. 502str15]MCO6385325.1 glucose 1-dehydrogenase [Oceanicola sp. 502str15]
MELGLKGRTAIITGGASGIGLVTARMMHAEGANVVLADISAEAAEARAAELNTDGPTRAIGVRCNVTDQEDVRAMVAHTLEEFGAVHILVNNAGLTRDMRIEKMEETDWDIVIDVILKGAYMCTRAVVPHFREQGWGRIVNISSRAHLGNAGQANYSAAKAGLIGFTRAMALEHGRNNVTVNAVAPGIIRTEMVESLPHFEKIKARAEEQLPIRRLGEPEDVAEAILFLASDRASYITGDLLHVSGGRYG